MKFGSMASFGGTSEQSTKVFYVKIFFPPTHEVFSHESFLYVGMHALVAQLVKLGP